MHLLMEALYEMKIMELKDHLKPEKFRFLVSSMLLGLKDLYRLKKTTVRDMCSLAVRALFRNVGKRVADEVVEVVYLADHRRRYESHRYTSVFHILWAVSQTNLAVRVSRIIVDSRMKPLSEEPEKYPIYDIYMSAANLAHFCGDEEIGIQHLVLAALFGRNGTSQNPKVLDTDSSMIADEKTWAAITQERSIRTFLHDFRKGEMVVIRECEWERIENLWPLEDETMIQFMERFVYAVESGDYSFPAIRQGL